MWHPFKKQSVSPQQLLNYVEELFNGMLEHASIVYNSPHPDLYTACKDTQFTVTAEAAHRVLRAYFANHISQDDANKWAAFVMDGHTPPDMPAHIFHQRYKNTLYDHGINTNNATDHEDGIIETVWCLRWVGHDADEVIDQKKVSELDVELGF